MLAEQPGFQGHGETKTAGDTVKGDDGGVELQPVVRAHHPGMGALCAGLGHFGETAHDAAMARLHLAERGLVGLLRFQHI